MKAPKNVMMIFLAIAVLVGCVSSESEMLRKARTIQDDMMISVNQLDSTMLAKLNVLNDERSEMAMDSTMSSDSTKLQSFMILKTKIDNISNLQSELADWKSNLKMLPDTKAIEGGAANPFGEKAKDEEILGEIRKSQEAFSDMKIKAEAAMK